MTNIEKILEKATDIFASPEYAQEWIETNSKTLGGKPVEICQTDEGLKKVLHHLTVISRHSINY